MHKETRYRRVLERLYYDFEQNGAGYRFFITSGPNQSDKTPAYRLQILKGKVLRIAGVEIDETVCFRYLEQEKLLYSNPPNLKSALRQFAKLLVTFFQPRISPSRYIHDLAIQFNRHEGNELDGPHMRQMAVMALRLLKDAPGRQRIPRIFNLENNPVGS